VASDIAGTAAVLDRVRGSRVLVQIGFQRRFDTGYAAARAAVRSGSLGQLHTVIGCTLDPAPPDAAYVAGSGGIFRDCAVHDLDILRWVTGQEVVEVYATGSNLGADYIREAGDVDAVAATLRLADGTLAQLSASRYNRAGYDVRMELRGHRDSIAVGLDPRSPLRSVEPDVAPGGPAYPGFLERFRGAYAAEISAFAACVAGGGRSLCTVSDALAAFVLAEACERSRREGRPVSVAEGDAVNERSEFTMGTGERPMGAGRRTRPIDVRLAGAPISWGVCEVPGWGPQLPAPVVLAEMARVGLVACEFGPDGFLPASGPDKARALAEHGLRAVGGFVPVVAHVPDRDPVADIASASTNSSRPAGTPWCSPRSAASTATRSGSNSTRRAGARCAATWTGSRPPRPTRGLIGGLHPHVGTLVERGADVERVLDGSSIGLCLDTGHLMVGGSDPLTIARAAADRVVHVHLKDVDAAIAARVRAGVLGYAQAVAAGLYRPLGRGEAKVAAVVSTLEAAGYDGWYVLEQDRVLIPDRAGSASALAAVRSDVVASIAHLSGAAAAQIGAA